MTTPEDIADQLRNQPPYPPSPGDSLADYQPGGSMPTDYGMDPGACRENICACLGPQLQFIGGTLYQINLTLRERLGKVCDHIEECLDKIIEGINNRYAGQRKTCEQCRAEVRSGLAGTLEHAITCASACISDCDAICSLGDTSTEGQCCDTCGQAKCICKDGSCVPVEEEEAKKKRYVGWCNRDSGLVVVLKEGESSPSPLYVSVSIADTESVALKEAEDYCSTYRQRPDKQYPQPLSPLAFPAPTCDPLLFANGTSLEAIARSGADAYLVAGFAEALQALGRVNVGFFSAGDIAGLLAGIYQGTLSQPPILANIMMPALASAIGCNNPAFTNSANVFAAFGIAQKSIGVDLSEFLTPYRYAMNASCRQKFLGTDQSMAAFLANGIDYQTLDAQWSVQGFCREAVEQYTQAARSKPVPLQLVMMRFRELINREQYHSGMRQLGYLDQDDSERIFTINKQLPTLSDIIRFMVRDTDDKALAERLHLNDYFDQKFGTELTKWAEWQGIDKQFMQHAWRAHWNIPAPTQLFEFWHRLRYNPQFGGKEKLLDDIKAALIQQDILPYWHEHYLAVSFRPLTRVDVRRAFNIGALKEDEVKDAFIQLGYSDEAADKQLKFSKRLRDIAAQSHKAIRLWTKFRLTRDAARERMIDDGLPDDIVDKALDDAEQAFITSPYALAYTRGDLSRADFTAALTLHGVSDEGVTSIADLLSYKITSSPHIRGYAVGTTSYDDALQAMQDDGMETTVAIRLLNKADLAIEQEMVLACQRGIKRRYLMGELTKDESIAELTNRGTTDSRARYLAKWWDCEKSAIGRAVTAAKLCDWLARGAITPLDFQERLIRMGYQPEVAGLMMEDCLISINARRLLEAKRQAKEQQAAGSRAARIARQNEAALQRETTRQEAARRKAATAKANRDKQLLSAGEKAAKKCACELWTALAAVKSEKARIQREFGLDVDSSLRVLLTAIEEWEGGDILALPPVITAMAELVSQVTPQEA